MLTPLGSLPSQLHSAHLKLNKHIQSQAVVTPTLVFVSGQVPRPPANSITSTTSASTSESSNPAIASDTALCIANIRAILKAAGSSLVKVVKTTVFLTDMERDFTAMNAE